MSREYLWGCELSSSNKEYVWDVDDEDDSGLYYNLLLKRAVLGQTAVKDEENLVELESAGFMGTTIKQPLFSLKTGTKNQCNLDILVGHPSTTIRLINGSGPVYLWGQHLVELNVDEDYDEAIAKEDSGSEEDEGHIDDEEVSGLINDVKEVEEEEEKHIDPAPKRPGSGSFGRAKKILKLEHKHGDARSSEEEDNEEDAEAEKAAARIQTPKKRGKQVSSISKKAAKDSHRRTTK